MDIGLGYGTTTLESRLTDLDTPVLMSGIQTLVRVLLEQSRLDRAAGLNTGASSRAIAARRWAGSIARPGIARRC